jgi:O-succinylbenzoic acid--CoA ligase
MPKFNEYSSTDGIVLTKTIPIVNGTFLYRTADASIRQEVETFIAGWEAGKTTFEVFTSGSTGIPKQIILHRDQLIASARRTLDFFGLQPNDTALLGISPKTIGGKMMIVRALTGDLKLIVASPSANPLAILESNETLDFCPMVPLQAQRILETYPKELLRIRTILFGGSPLSEKLERQLHDAHPSCYIGYGMTETVSHVAIRSIGDPSYTAMRGVHFAEAAQQLVITDDELGIRQLLTNDQVELLNERQFNWLGRTDFTINSGGVKIHPEQLERVLAGLMDIPFFISAEPDDTFGEKCIIIVDDTHDAPSLETIQQHCKQEIGAYAAPKTLYRTAIVFSNGTKINRRETLRQLGIGI